MRNSPLQLIDFISPDGNPTSGLVPVRSADKMDLSIDEKTAIFDATSFKEIDFVFFRRFSDGRSSQILAYVVDNSDRRLDEKALTVLHLRIWLQGATPLFYVAWPSRIDVLSCARGPDFYKSEDKEFQYNPAKKIEFEDIEIAGKITQELNEFSAFRLSDGTFWDKPDNNALADQTKAAHQALIQAVVEADKDLDGKNNPILRRLLLLIVLIKYLEDRHVFPGEGWFGRYHKGARNFFEVLKGGEPNEVYRLLGFLERKFNGDVFFLPRNGPQELTKENLRHFADLVEARTLSRQRYLWEQFSFEHLPVEIISHLYQRFVQGGHGTVYTPPFLASLLLDHSMPYKSIFGDERILDPACGSGVFLVGAFRRLINIWRSRNNWQRPQVDTLKEILNRSIYGIELDSNAIDLTAFSLSLAICDALQPEVIWSDLIFNPLRNSNLFEGDFFRFVLDRQQNVSTLFEKGFDLVIGNPPFESELSPAGEEVNLILQRQDIDRGSLPDKQSAYLFLESALAVVRPGGRVCLIQPSSFLYNRKAQNFRHSIFRKYEINSIFDFTSIRNLYEADPKTIAVSAGANAPLETHWTDHWTFRRTVSVHKRICFELDHYDRHRVSQEQAETDAYVWRANLLGGGRLLDMSQRLRRLRTLSEYVKEKGWDYGEGFIAAKKGSRPPAPFLTGKPFLPTVAFSNSGIDESKIGIVEETHFRSAYTKDRYSAPLILLKEIDSLPVIFWDNGFIAYRHKIVGIHAPQPQVTKLRKLYDTIRKYHKKLRFSCALNGTQSLVGKSTAILKQDIDLLPFPDDLNDLSFSFWEEALCEDVLKYMTEFIRLGQNSVLLRKAADVDSLRDYSGIFLKMLGTIYENLQASDPIIFNGLICQPFYFGERPNLSWLAEGKNDGLKKIVYEENKHAYLRTVRVLRYYSENVMLLVKPDRLRYWIPSTAIRDADETLVDLRRQGY